MTKVSIIIPGNTNRTPATTFSNPKSLNFLNVTTEIKANAGTTAKYKIASTMGSSVIKKNCPAKRKAKVAKNQIKKPTPSTGTINFVLAFSILEIFNKGNIPPSTQHKNHAKDTIS